MSSFSHFKNTFTYVFYIYNLDGFPLVADALARWRQDIERAPFPGDQRSGERREILEQGLGHVFSKS